MKLLIEKKEGIVIATVNRPKVRNALDHETWKEIRSLIRDVENCGTVQVLIFTGAGEKAFVAGADVSALQARSMLDTIKSENLMVLNALGSMEKITIAAVNGFALGGGCELALTCDFRIAAQNARFGLPELGLGILPGAGGTQRLQRLVGPARAKEMILTGKIVDAQEALGMGLVNTVVPEGESLAAALAMAEKIMAKGPLAVRLCKMVIDRGAEACLESGLSLENLAQTVIFASEDRAEGLSAFLEKRPPVFKGK